MIIDDILKKEIKYRKNIIDELNTKLFMIDENSNKIKQALKEAQSINRKIKYQRNKIIDLENKIGETK